MRPLLPLLFVLLLTACAPTRDPGPPGDDPAPEEAADLYEAMEPGQCQAWWEGDPPGWLGLGEGAGTTGLWYALDCYDSAGASLTFDLANLNPEPGDAPIQEINARSSDGSAAGMESIDNTLLHIEAGDWSGFGGWWEGEAEMTADDGTQLVLQAVVFKDLPVDSVVGR